jgi:hypothetical protein
LGGHTDCPEADYARNEERQEYPAPVGLAIHRPWQKQRTI